MGDADMARGGKRPGSGRKSRWGVETVVIRVPVNLKDEVQEFIDRRMAKLMDKPSRDPETQLQPVIEAWENSQGRCQASTTRGTRCGNASSVIERETQPDGRVIEYSVCALHYGQIRRGLPVHPHPSVLKTYQIQSAEDIS